MSTDQNFSQMISTHLEALGLEPAGMSRDQEFFEKIHDMTAAFVKSIEKEMGGPMPEHVQHIVHGVIEKAAHMSGPQLTVEFSF